MMRLSPWVRWYLGRDKEGRRLYSDAYKACPPTLTGPTTAATVQVRGGWAVEGGCEGSRSLTWGNSGGAMAGASKPGCRGGVRNEGQNALVLTGGKHKVELDKGGKTSDYLHGCASLSICFLPFSGVFHLHQGDILSVVIPRARAKLSLSPHGTFLGLVKL